MMYTAFTFWSRFLVLLGLCLINNAFASQCTAGSITRDTPTAAASAYQSTQMAAGFTALITANSVRSGTSTYDFTFAVSRADGSFYQNNVVTATCTCVDATSGNYLFRVPFINSSLSDPSFFENRNTSGINTTTNLCINYCVHSMNIPASKTFNNNTDLACPAVDATGASCLINMVPTGATCLPPLPVICQAPQVLNGNNQCETPACPTGQQRETSLGACKPIVCYAPLVKVGDICKLPECPTGQTYEFSNGAGSCVKNDPLCTTPLINKNGVCVLPTCATGMVLDSVTGVCKPNPVNNPNTSSGSGTGTGTGTATGTGTSGGTTGTSGGGGSPTPITNTNGTTSAGTTNTTSPTPTGSSTNTSGTGTCTTAPCGTCDPTKETCGDTFGGSCKSGFKCNGDAIQCAVAQATNKSECELQALSVDTEKDTAFIEGKAAFDAGTKALGKDGGIAVASGGAITINSSNPFSSSCPADMQFFTYKGTQYMLPLAQYCNIFQIMGNIMLLCASLIALKIIMKVE